MARDEVKLLRDGDNDLEMQSGLLLAYIGTQLAQWVYDARTRAGLSQSELARRIGTSQPAIARLESADYSGHSLRIVSKIACALGQSLEIQVNPKRWRAKKPGGTGRKGGKKRSARNASKPRLAAASRIKKKRPAMTRR